MPTSIAVCSTRITVRISDTVTLHELVLQSRIQLVRASKLEHIYWFRRLLSDIRIPNLSLESRGVGSMEWLGQETGSPRDSDPLN